MPLPDAVGARWTFRAALLAGVSAVTLLAGGAPAMARNILVGAGASTAAANAAASAVASAQQAAAMTQQSMNSLSRATQAIQAMQAAQSAAHNLALSAPSSVANGLATGGLVPDSGLASNGVANPVTSWVNANTPTQTTSNGQTLVTIQQTAQKAILNWQTFNVGTKTTVDFNQQGNASWVVLNRVQDPTGVPSQILGQINAAGSVYLINRNGIIFGGASQINVNSLLATSLDLFSTDIPTSNSYFLNYGIGDRSASWWQGLLVSDTTDFNATDTALATTYGDVTVQPGASITGADKGLILLAAPHVTNGGMITVPDGQVALIGGIGVDYLYGATGYAWDDSNTPLTSTNIVDFFNIGQALDWNVGVDLTPHGSVANTGLIEVPRGNITLRAAAIDQEGVLAVSTSVKRAGSITINAVYEETIPEGYGENDYTGPVTFGSNAVIAILPDSSDGTVPMSSASAVALGTIAIQGLSIDFKGGSLTYAPAQTISANVQYDNWYEELYEDPAYVASCNSSAGCDYNWNDYLPAGAGRLFVENGAVLDVSGLANTEVPVAATLLTVTLGANELADSPLQLAGFLYGKTITVDTTLSGTRADGLTWVGTPLANLSSYLNTIPETIGQVLVNGGSVSLAGGEADLAAGAIINLTGGYVHYLGGVVDTTRLVDASGHLVNIGQADPNDTYVGIAGVFTVDHPHWGITQTYDSSLVSGGAYEPDYIAGGNAGALGIGVDRDIDNPQSYVNYVVNGGVLVLDATILTGVETGLRQVESGNLPTTATLAIATDFSVEIGDADLLSATSLAASQLPDGLAIDSPLLGAYPSGSEPPSNYYYNSYPPATTPWANSYLNGNVLTSQELAQGFSQISIASSEGQIVVDAGASVTVQNGGSISLTGGYVDVEGALIAHAGTISIGVTNYSANPGLEAPYWAPQAVPNSSIVVGANGVLDVSGVFINDTGAAVSRTPVDVNGGSITLTVNTASGTDTNGSQVDTTGSIVLASGSLLNASGGGYVQPSGALKTGSNQLPLGSGGNVTFDVTAGNAPLGDAYAPDAANSGLTLDGTIEALGFSGGGTITIDALSIQLGGEANAARPAYAFLFDPTVWGALGFGSFVLNAAYDAVVPDGTVITLQHSNLVPNLAIDQAPTGADVAAYATAAVLPAGLRPATNLTIAAGQQHNWGAYWGGADFTGSDSYGTGADTAALSLDEAVIGLGAAIDADPGAAISIASKGAVVIDGGIVAHGGTISIASSSYNNSNSYPQGSLIYLGPQSRLDVSGTTVLDPLTDAVRTADGIIMPRTGSVLAGGSVTFSDPLGAVVAAAGSVIDVAGAADSFDVRSGSGLSGPVYQQQAAWSDGGSITITTMAGLLLDSTLIGNGGAAQANGATFTLNTEDGNPSVDGVGAIVLVQNATAAGLNLNAAGVGSFVPAGFAPGVSGSGITITTTGGALTQSMPILLGTDSLNDSGFANLVLNGPTVAYSGAVTLALKGSVVMEGLGYTGIFSGWGLIALPATQLNVPVVQSSSFSSPTMDGSLSVTAAYIDLAGASETALTPYNPADAFAYGDGRLTLAAREIDLSGGVGINDVANTTLISQTDIRFVGGTAAANGTSIYAELGSAGNITLDAARITATTGTDAIIEAANSAGQPTTVAFGYPAGVAADTHVPLAAGGLLLVDATTIIQGGNLDFPFGQIILGVAPAAGSTTTAVFLDSFFGTDASGESNVLGLAPSVVTQAVTLAAGSITSVSGAGTIIPYGSTTDGLTWQYDPFLVADDAASGNASAFYTPLTAPPAKAITLTGTSIAINRGATVDLSGGGDLQASEFVPGTGGSRDVLSATSVPTGETVYAILPGYDSPVAAYDAVIDYGLSNKSAGQGSYIGEAVYLSGVPGLASGIYTLLPADYATLPGSYRVVVGSTAVTANVTPTTLADGTVVTSGYLADALTGTHSATTVEVLVQSSSVWRKYTEYDETSANAFFPAYAATNGYVTPSLPKDAGHLTIGGTTTTAMVLDGTMLTSAGSTDGQGAQIDIVAQDIQIVGAGETPLPGYIQLTATELDNLDAGSLLIGGVRTIGKTGVTITPEATNVVVSNDAADPLTAPEILLVATPTLTAVTTQPGIPGSIQLDQEDDPLANESQTYNYATGTWTYTINYYYTVAYQTVAGTGLVTIEPGSVVEAIGATGRSVPTYYGTSLSPASLTPLPDALERSVIATWNPSASIGSTPIQKYYNALIQDLGAIVQVSNGAGVTVYQPTAAQLAPGPIQVLESVNASGIPTYYTMNLPSLSGGTVSIQAGATVLANNTLTLAGVADTQIARGATIGAANVNLDSSQITFVAPSYAGPLPTTGAVLDPGFLNQVQGTGTIVLTSAGGIDFLGDVTLAQASGTLDLNTGALTTSTGSAVAIGAPTVQFTNTLGLPTTSAVAGNAGTLAVTATELDFGAGDKAFYGFGTVQATAGAGIVGQGTGSADFGAANVTLDAPVVIAATGSAQSLTTTGALALKAAAGTALSFATAVGGAIGLTASTINDDAPIEARAGNVALEATAGDVTIAAPIDVSAVSKAFYDVTEYASAGNIALTASAGAVTVQSGARLDFSAIDAGGGNAGSLSISAPAAGQNATLAGTILGGAVAGYQGGSFSLDVGGAQNLDTLVAMLKAAGIDSQILIATGAGNLSLTGTLAANAVSITANGGLLTVAGGAGISALGTANSVGEIDLYGGQGVDIEGSLLATGSPNSQQPGGTISIGTTGAGSTTSLNAVYGYENVDPTASGTITVGANATINASGGTITFRAPLLDAVNPATGININVAIAPGATIAGGTVNLDAYAVWSTADQSTNPNQHFDGIVDPAGWYDRNGNLVSGSFYDSTTGALLATVTDNGTTTTLLAPDGTDVTSQLATFLADDYFTPTTYNAAHAVFYGGYDPNTETFNPVAPDAGSLPAFIQQPGFNFGNAFSGIANFQARPEIDLVNPVTGPNRGAISVLTNWNLGAGVLNNGVYTLAYRYNQTIAPVIGLLAGGNLNIKASISDGFFQNAVVALPTSTSPYTYTSDSNEYTNYSNSDEISSFLLSDGTTQTPYISVDANGVLTSPGANELNGYYGNYNVYANSWNNWYSTTRTQSIWIYFNYAPWYEQLPVEYQADNISAPPSPSSFTNYSEFLAQYTAWETSNFANAPVPSAYTSYSAYLTAYAAYYTNTAVFAQYADTLIPAPPVPPSDPTQYSSYVSAENSYVNYTFNDLYSGSVYARVYIYAPAAPALEPAPAVVASLGNGDNPSNMPTASNPLPQAFATLMAAGPASASSGLQQSASYQLVAGADFASADPMATLAGAGSVSLDGHTAYHDQNVSNQNQGSGSPAANGSDILEPTTVRTGTGSITIASGGDITFLDPMAPATVYTAGQPIAGTDMSNISPAVTLMPSGGGSYVWGVVSGNVNAQGAGDITLAARGDIIGVELAQDDVSGSVTGYAGGNLSQFWGPWLIAGTTTSTTETWYVNFSTFDQGVMSLGGNVTVTAGGDIRDLAVSLPTTATITTTPGNPQTISSLTAPDGVTSYLVYTGGGVLTVNAAGSIVGGDYYVGQGSGTLQAGNAVTSGAGYDGAIPTILAVQNGTIAVAARQGVEVGAVYDPTDIGGEFSMGLQIDSGTANSGVFLASTAGAVTLGDLSGTGSLFNWASGPFYTYSAGLGNFESVATLLPATVSLTAFDGGIAVNATLGSELFPSPTGELSLIANQSIALQGASQTPLLDLLDYPLNAGFLPSALNDVFVSPTDGTTPYNTHDSSLLHAADTQPVRLYSLEGDITDGVINPNTGLVADNIAVVPDKPADIYAAGSIVNLAFYGQNDAASDLTRIVAGGNITDTAITTNSNAIPAVLELAGPGNFDIEAGGDITFQSDRIPAETTINDENIRYTPETGIRTIGNSIDNVTFAGYGETAYSDGTPLFGTVGFGNPYLPRGGASITVLFGVKPGIDYAAFIANYIDPSEASSANYLGVLAPFVDQYETQIGNTAPGDLTSDQAWAIFQTLSPARQEILIDQVFFNIMETVGTDYNNPSSSFYHQYGRGYVAINTLFPAGLGYTANSLSGGTNGASSPIATGTLVMLGSTIQTQQGGNIAILGPGGSILAGTQAALPSDVSQSSEGIITFEQGSIDTFTDGSVEVAQSRIMTEQGGAITMWSSNGDLNAGKGTKTTVSFPPEVFSTNLDLYTINDERGEVTGAGIATLQTLPGVPVGDATLVAPRGTVDAGAAGIRVSGNLSVAALHVANAFNIQVQGITTGVPTAAMPNIGALTAASNAMGASVAAAAEAATHGHNQPTQQDLPSIITVEVIGYGGGGNEQPEQPPEQQRRRRDDRQSSYDPASAVQVVGAGRLASQEQTLLTDEEKQKIGNE